MLKMGLETGETDPGTRITPIVATPGVEHMTRASKNRNYPIYR